MLLCKLAEQAQQNNNSRGDIYPLGTVGAAGAAGYGAYHGVKNELEIKHLEFLEKNKDKVSKLHDALGLDPKEREEMFKRQKGELEGLKKARGKNALFLLGGTAGMLGFNHLESKKDNKKYKNTDNLYSDMSDNVAGTAIGATGAGVLGVLGATHGLLGNRRKALGYAAASVPLLAATYFSSNRAANKAKNNKDLMESDAYKDAQKQNQPVM